MTCRAGRRCLRLPDRASRATPQAAIAALALPGRCATIFQGIIDPGPYKTWTDRRAVTPELGNPGAVTLAVDGETAPGFRVARDPRTTGSGKKYGRYATSWQSNRVLPDRV
jgi:hypothetical protein